MALSPLLPHLGSCIAGSWTGSAAAPPLTVTNPANGNLLARVPAVGAAQTATAIEAATAALYEPASPPARRAWLLGIHEALLAEQAELERLITLENGKPLKESLAEVAYAAGFFGYFAGQLDHLRPRELPDAIRGCRWTVPLRPAGVVGLITPWNFPLAMLAKKLSAALVAGCAVVARPASATPLTAMALWALLERLALPLDR